MAIISAKQQETERVMRRVLQRIQVATKQYPVTYDALAEEFFPGAKKSSGWRRIAMIVERLRDEGWKIATTNQEPYGCFYARNSEDLLPTIRRMQDQARAIWFRAKKMSHFEDQEPTLFEAAVQDEEFEEELSDGV